MNAAEIKRELAKLGVKPNRRLGQNFLIDQNILNKIVDTAAISPGDLVLEIGPGLGVLTAALLDKGAEVVAIEKDRLFAKHLDSPSWAYPAVRPRAHGRGERSRMGLRGQGGVTIVRGDAATMHWHDLIGDRPWKFVSNLPYQITSLALRKALWSPRPPDVVVVLVQKEVADRIIKREKTSLLSLMVAFSSESVRIVKRVSRNSFYPIPKVESAILHIVPMPWREREKKWGISPDEIMAVARRGFAHPRKLLTSNLNIAPSVLEALDIPAKARAEDLSPEDWARLSIQLSSRGSD